MKYTKKHRVKIMESYLTSDEAHFTSLGMFIKKIADTD